MIYPWRSSTRLVFGFLFFGALGFLGCGGLALVGRRPLGWGVWRWLGGLGCRCWGVACRSCGGGCNDENSGLLLNQPVESRGSSSLFLALHTPIPNLSRLLASASDFHLSPNSAVRASLFSASVTQVEVALLLLLALARCPTSLCTSLCRARTGASPSQRLLDPLLLLSLTTPVPHTVSAPTG